MMWKSLCKICSTTYEGSGFGWKNDKYFRVKRGYVSLQGGLLEILFEMILKDSKMILKICIKAE